MRKNWTEMIALLLVAALLTMGFSGCAPASEPVGPGPGVDEPVDPIEPTPPEPPALELTVFGDSTYPGDAFGVEIKNSGDELPVVSFTLDEDTYDAHSGRGVRLARARRRGAGHCRNHGHDKGVS